MCRHGTSVHCTCSFLHLVFCDVFVIFDRLLLHIMLSIFLKKLWPDEIALPLQTITKSSIRGKQNSHQCDKKPKQYPFLQPHVQELWWNMSTRQIICSRQYINPWGLGATYNLHFLATEHQHDQTSFNIHRRLGGGCKIFYLLRHSFGLCPQT